MSELLIMVITTLLSIRNGARRNRMQMHQISGRKLKLILGEFSMTIRLEIFRLMLI
jgi:hypothetical protein